MTEAQRGKKTDEQIGELLRKFEKANAEMAKMLAPVTQPALMGGDRHDYTAHKNQVLLTIA